jgi:hypothetical protein
MRGASQETPPHLRPLQRVGLLWHLEYNPASAGYVAGTTGFVAVEVAAVRGRAKDVAAGVQGKHIVRWYGSVGSSKKGVQNCLGPGAAVGIGGELVRNATAAADVACPVYP